MTTYSAQLNDIETLAEEMNALGGRVQSMIEQLTADCNASLAEWAGNAQSVYHGYATTWTNAANDLPVQAAAGQQALAQIIDAMSLAESQGSALWNS